MSDETMTGAVPIRGLVPMIFVENVERSVTFYQLLGFDVGHSVPEAGPMHWAWLYAPKAADWKHGPNLMLTRSEAASPREREDVLFYLYATDLTGLRADLLEKGADAGEITFPEYLPNGEFCLRDPDGYTLMIAQAGPRTP